MIKIFKDEKAVAQAIAKEMNDGLQTANPVFCLASGSTPAKGYDLFSKLPGIKDKVKHLQIVSLDEWVGIEQENTGSCYKMLEDDLFHKIDLKENQIHFYNGLANDLTQECKRIDRFLEENPITFSLMGVGMNGHIGLNEPGSPTLDYGSIVELSKTTKEVAQKYFNEATSLEKGITLGLQQIINSKRVIVVMTGSHKAQIAKEIIDNSELKLPAQQLLGFGHIDFYLDEAAAQYLDEKIMRSA